jgi:hypothetical protein
VIVLSAMTVADAMPNDPDATNAIGPKVYDGFKTGTCGTTNHAAMNTHGPMKLDYVMVWMDWEGDDGTTVPYWLVVNNQTVKQGNLKQVHCDPTRAPWCQAGVNLGGVVVGTGRVEIRIQGNYICETTESGGAGFVQFWGTYD